jgi:hypothetical protein
MDYKKILILSSLIGVLILIRIYVIPTLACSLQQEKVDTTAGIQEFRCSKDLDCQSFDIPNQRLVYFWGESERAQIGVEINTTQTKENIYRRVCENGVCVHKKVETYYLPFTFNRKNDGTLEIPMYMVEGRNCIGFNGGECSFNISGKIKFYKDLNGRIVDIKCITCNSSTNTINGTIEINETSSTVGVKKYVIEECDPVCGASVECSGGLPNEFMVKKISQNYYSVGFCNETCQFTPLTLETFRAYVIDVCAGKIEISPQSSLTLTNEDKLNFYVKLSLKKEKFPKDVRVIINITRSGVGKEETIKRCENDDVCETTIDASVGSYFATLTVIVGGDIVKQEKTYPIQVAEVKECTNCGEIVKTQYRKDLVSVKKCLCGHWACGEKGGCCKNEDCWDWTCETFTDCQGHTSTHCFWSHTDRVCKGCVCTFNESYLPLSCFNITKITMSEEHREIVKLPSLFSHVKIAMRAFNFSLKGSFFNDVNETVFNEKECGENKAVVVPGDVGEIVVFPKDLPQHPCSSAYQRLKEGKVSWSTNVFSSTFKPGDEKTFSLSLILSNYLISERYPSGSAPGWRE